MARLKALDDAWEAVVAAAARQKDELSHVTKNLDEHIDKVKAGYRGVDKFNESPNTPDYSSKPHRPEPGETSGPVVFYDPKGGATPAQQAQVQSYVDGCNDARNDGYIAPEGRVSTTGDLRAAASSAAAKEKAGGSYDGHAGHVPDTTWTGTPDPHSWLDLDPSVNQSLGGQSRRYPLGYQPTEFVYGGPHPS